MIENIFGNMTAKRVLLHIYHYGEIHASGIAKDYDVSVTPILNQLKRFELSGVLVSKQVGKSRLYLLNPKSPYMNPVKAILKLYYDSLSLEEKQKQFNTRRRPRRKGKPVL